jgi:hypothetical protein
MLVLATMELVAYDMYAYEMHAILAPGTRIMLIPEECWHQSNSATRGMLTPKGRDWRKVVAREM